MVFTSSGDANGDRGGNIRAHADKVLDCVNSSWAKKRANGKTTLRKGLRELCGWNPKSEEEFAVDWAMSGEDADGLPAKLVRE